MWQRIQTLYFILVIGLMTAAILLPNAEFFLQEKNITYQLDSRGMVELDEQGAAKGVIGTNPLTFLFGFIIFIALYTIISFKNRRRQIRMATINLLLIIIYIAAMVIYIMVAKNKLNAIVTWNYPVIFPLIALIFNYLGMRGVAKDEKLVRSLDRLR
ncbi:MAG TPA: DUF4293 domain-containing protein [Bacteroidales bacterium]|nr:DUF4293 domain-containing protein [Bacteroidales bacterium]